MNLIYTSAEHTTIQCTLDANETLGNQVGPVVCFVPTDPSNREYSEIEEKALPISPYVPPPPP